MISKLEGIVDTINENSVIIDINGVGYEVSYPERAIDTLVEGSKISVYIKTIFRDDTIYLYGFSSIEDRTFFNMLQTVQGVGAKLAMTIIGFFETEEIAKYISSADEKSITMAPGVGAKVAKRIITELKDKFIDSFQQSTDNYSTKRNSIISALLNLGYPRTEAVNIVEQLNVEINQDLEIEELIRMALRRTV
ncbi:MAG: Holliday junction branch migration protein RuvA [Hyphomicrobiales bacterium]